MHLILQQYTSLTDLPVTDKVQELTLPQTFMDKQDN